MPIEFNCRICNAMIRVSDKAAGGKGRCPKCGIRITVPKKSPSKPAAKPTEPEEQFVLPGFPAETSPVEAPIVDDDSDDVVMLEPAGFEPEDLIAPPREEFSLDKPMAPPPSRLSVQRSKKRKRNGNPLMIVIVVGVLAVVAGGAYFLYPILTAERISGELTAGTAKTLDLPPVLIHRSEIKLPADELDILLKKLESSPIPLTSNSMQMELSGTSKGLQISVASTSQSQFYRVNLKGNERIQKYLDKNFADFEDQRRREVEQAATDFFLEYQSVIGKKSTSEKIAVFRDSLAIPALVRGFGHFLVAEHGRGLYRCVYEDRDGGLYFLLPTDVQSFKIVGRRGANDRELVPADFDVKVEGEIAPLKMEVEKSSPKSKAASKSKPAKEEPEMGDDETSGKK